MRYHRVSLLRAGCKPAVQQSATLRYEAYDAHTIARVVGFIYSQSVHCVVTAGPTYEALDKVRRLTNFSTGRLGCELAAFLTDRGHEVTLLIGEQATYSGPRKAARVATFSTTADLSERLHSLANQRVQAVCHPAAVSDFAFGKIFQRSGTGELAEIKSAKISTRQGTLLAELVPTGKIIAQLRSWFPQAWIAGWKYEVDGDRAGALGAARDQIQECHTNACVANGPAYGKGFGLVRLEGESMDLASSAELFAALEELMITRLGQAAT